MKENTTDQHQYQQAVASSVEDKIKSLTQAVINFYDPDQLFSIEDFATDFNLFLMEDNLLNEELEFASNAEFIRELLVICYALIDWEYLKGYYMKHTPRGREREEI